MRIVLVLVVLVLVLLVWRAFVFDRKHRGQLRSAADISGDAKRHRDEQNKGSDPKCRRGTGATLTDLGTLSKQLVGHTLWVFFSRPIKASTLSGWRATCCA